MGGGAGREVRDLSRLREGEEARRDEREWRDGALLEFLSLAVFAIVEWMDVVGIF